MDNLAIGKTKRTPAIDFDFTNHIFSISGESYPENITRFYGEIMTRLKSYLSEVKDQNIEVKLDLVYFNSSSAKIMIQIFDMLDAAGEKK